MNTGLRQNEREIVVSKIQKGEVGGGGGDGDGGGSGGGGGDGGGSNSSSSSLAFLNEPAVAHDIQKTRARSRVFTSPLKRLEAIRGVLDCVAVTQKLLRTPEPQLAASREARAKLRVMFYDFGRRSPPPPPSSSKTKRGARAGWRARTYRPFNLLIESEAREATAWQAASRQGERPSGGVDETELRPCDPTHDLVRQTTLRALASMSVGRVLGDHPSQ
uniref:Uncharacterized protein n=1 Tax=Vespula pensylvanica TaxID=30213 RepID=A0A834NGW3_VESPE|nr:hypothetical protein H0235_013739 [Vespula pensylvanica]